MKISIKLILYSWLVFFGIIALLLFNAYNNFKPENFIAIINEQVQKNYPNSKLTIDKVYYGVSLDFSLNLKKIQIEKNNQLLAKLDELELKVPWWLLLTNRGNAQISLKSLEIFIDHEIEASSPNGGNNKKPEKISIFLPAYLADARYTLKATNIKIKDIQTEQTRFAISKLLVREFQYGKNSAFELNIPISIKSGQTIFHSDLWLFGDVTPDLSFWALNYRGEFRTRDSSDKWQLDDLVLTGKTTFFPAGFKTESEILMSLDKEQVASARLNVDEEFLNVSLKTFKLPSNYLGMLSENIQVPYLKKLDGVLAGQIQVKKNLMTSLISVNGSIGFDGDFHLDTDQYFSGNWQLKFDNSKWIISFMAPQGEVSFFRRFVVDLKTNKTLQYVEELGFENKSLTEVLKPLHSIESFISNQDSIYHTTTISFKNCFVEDKKWNGEFNFGLTPDEKFYLGNLNSEKSKLEISFLSKKSHQSLSVTLTEFNLISYLKIFDGLLEMSEGHLNGKIEGRWTDNWSGGDWLIGLKVKDFKNISGKLIDITQSLTSVFNLDTKSYSQTSMNLTAKDGAWNVKEISLGEKNKLRITGKLFSNKKSYLSLSTSNKTAPLKKELKENFWPIGGL